MPRRYGNIFRLLGSQSGSGPREAIQALRGPEVIFALEVPWVPQGGSGPLGASAQALERAVWSVFSGARGNCEAGWMLRVPILGSILFHAFWL